MNKGLVMMLKSFGINIDPKQIEGFVVWAQTNVPVAVKQFNEMIERQKRTEEKLDQLLKDGGFFK